MDKRERKSIVKMLLVDRHGWRVDRRVRGDAYGGGVFFEKHFGGFCLVLIWCSFCSFFWWYVPLLNRVQEFFLVYSVTVNVLVFVVEACLVFSIESRDGLLLRRNCRVPNQTKDPSLWATSRNKWDNTLSYRRFTRG